MTQTATEWLSKWLDAVAAGGATMSQRSLHQLELRGGDLRLLRRLAKQRGVHLLLVRLDDGKDVVAASLHPFKVIC
jgi:DNA polymerase III delta subunit